MEIAPRHINVDNICAKISFEYGNKICNEFPQCNDKKMESFVFKWTNYVYGKDDANNIQKKFNHDNFQNKIENKIQEVGERA